MKQAKSRRWVIIVAGLLILVGVLAFAVPLVVQQMNYATASREADELANTMNLPQEDAYQMVDYSQMPQGETPTYEMSEMQDAGNAPSILDSLIPAGWIPPALAEEVDEAQLLETMSMRQAMETAGSILLSCQSLEELPQALTRARSRVEQGFFILTGVQPGKSSQSLKVTNNSLEETVRLDRAVTAARELVYATLTDFEGLLYQVESRLEAGEPEALVLDEAHTLGSYFANFALHLPADDFTGLTTLAEAAAKPKSDPGNAVGLGEENPDAVIAEVDQETDVERSYLLEIPDIGVKVTCRRSGTFNRMYANMKKGVAFFPRAPEPNTVGNICISGHRTGTRDYFRKVDKLSAGDTIFLHTTHLGSFKYQVEDVYVIERDDWKPTYATSYPALTIISCEEYQGVSNGKRIVVRAKLVGVAPNNDAQ